MAPPIRRILVPTDFSEHSRQALERALELAERMGATIDLLHVWDTPGHLEPFAADMLPEPPGANLETLGLAQAGRLLHAWSEQYASRSVPLHVHLARGPAADTILLFASNGYDLLVMGTHGRTGLARLMMGSVAQKVARRAPCPVMTVHASEEHDVAPSAP
jgi:nucleotide-binding universal stress UspA family protein